VGDKIHVMVSLEDIQCISVMSLLAGVIKVYRTITEVILWY